MHPNVLTFMEKLPRMAPGQVMEVAGERVDLSIKRVSLLLPDLALEQQRMMGILLQHTSPANFTLAELREVATLKLPLLDNNVNERLPIVIRPGRLYDSGTYRVNRQLAQAGLDEVKLAFAYASASAFSPANVMSAAIGEF